MTQVLSFEAAIEATEAHAAVLYECALASTPIRRRRTPIPVAQFDEVVAEALAAFRTDHGYAVKMAARASEILVVRERWANRIRDRLLAAEEADAILLAED